MGHCDFTAGSTADQSFADNEPMISKREALAPWQARCIEAYIAAHLHSRIRVMDLVRVLKFAPNRFDRVFKATFGCTPHQYVMRRRIARAQKLLLISDDALGRIAADCGFGNQSHLCNLFRKAMGQPPGVWRRVNANAYHMPPRATVIASPLTPPAASLQRNAITCATSRGSNTRFCG
jgi:AraC-like DNA-binding protein